MKNYCKTKVSHSKGLDPQQQSFRMSNIYIYICLSPPSISHPLRLTHTQCHLLLGVYWNEDVVLNCRLHLCNDSADKLFQWSARRQHCGVFLNKPAQ
jgi:hypothetical protein